MERKHLPSTLTGEYARLTDNPVGSRHSLQHSKLPRLGSLGGSRTIAHDVESARRSKRPARIMDRGEGCGAVAGVGREGDANTRMDVWCVVVPERVAP